MEKLADIIPGRNGDAIQGLNLLLQKLQVKRALKDFGTRLDRAEVKLGYTWRALNYVEESEGVSK